MAGITISGGLVLSGVFLGDGGGPGPGPGPGPAPVLAGKLYTWGVNTLGQTGSNDRVVRSSPTQVGSDATWLVLSTSYTSLGVKSDGTLWSWGEGDTGELGIGVNGNRSSPVQIGSDTDWEFATQSGTGGATGAACFAIKTDGSLWAWGKNTDNTWLGLDTDTGNKNSPVQVGSDSWISVGSGLNWTVGIKSNGTLWGWGSPFNGSVPLDGAGGGYIGSPTAIGSDTNWSKVIPSNFWTGAALKTDGSLWTWGYNNWGQLGDNTVVNKSSPVQLGSNIWQDAGLSASSLFAITTGGAMYVAGRGNFGTLGLNNTDNKSSPVQLGSNTDWARVTTGQTSSTLAVKTDGTLWGWGRPPVGNNTAVNISSPVQIGSGTDWQGIASGIGTYMAISST